MVSRSTDVEAAQRHQWSSGTRMLPRLGGEHAGGMFPDHDYYDPRRDKWVKLPNMPIPVHGGYRCYLQKGTDLGRRRQDCCRWQQRDHSEPSLSPGCPLRGLKVKVPSCRVEVRASDTVWLAFGLPHQSLC